MNQRNKSSRQRTSARSDLYRAMLVAGGVIALALVGFLVWSLSTSSVDSPGSVKVTPEVTGAPRLKADSERIELGNVRLGQTVQAAFTLSNAGDRPLQITEKPYIEVLEGC